jgi:hypothetical protein
MDRRGSLRLVFIEHDIRRMHTGRITASPTGEWTSQRASSQRRAGALGVMGWDQPSQITKFHGGQVGIRSAAVSSAGDRVAHHAEQRQNQAGHQHDDADGPDNSDFGDETDDKQRICLRPVITTRVAGAARRS